MGHMITNVLSILTKKLKPKQQIGQPILQIMNENNGHIWTIYCLLFIYIIIFVIVKNCMRILFPKFIRIQIDQNFKICRTIYAGETFLIGI